MKTAITISDVSRKLFHLTAADFWDTEDYDYWTGDLYTLGWFYEYPFSEMVE